MASGTAAAFGYDEGFLGIGVPLPAAEDEAAEAVRLDYVHFSVVLDRQRRLARVTAVNIDGAALVDVPRGDEWRLDDRIPADWQAGPDVYARNDLDRGHLVRRRDPVWGDRAAQANSDMEQGAAAGGIPDLGPFRTYQVPVADIAGLTGLDLDQLAAADVLGQAATARPWQRLRAFSDIRL